jgi:hypothetical protein
VSGCPATTSRNDTTFSDTALPHPFQEIQEISKHQNLPLQAAPAPPALSPILASLASRHAASGVRHKPGEKQGKPPAPTLRHILLEDLQDTGRLQVLLDQARRAGLIGKTDPERLTFAAMATHALRVGQDNPCGLFVSLLHDEQCQRYLTDADDEAARVRLRAYDDGIDPQRRAPPPPRASAPPPLSPDARFVAEVLQRLPADWRDRPLLAVQLVDPAWTPARWDQAVGELAAYQHGRQQAPVLPAIEEPGMDTDWRASPFPADLECAECGEGGPACVCPAVEDNIDR